MFNKLKSLFNNGQNKKKGIVWEDDIRPGCTLNSLLGCDNNQTYDNTFADITRIAEAFAEVSPYAIDASGRKLAKQPQFVKALYNPNRQMSGSDFFETLIVFLLVHPTVYLLCWHYENGELVAGGPITKDNIAGFTFLEGIAVSRVAGVTTYMDGTRTWGVDDVIALSLNVNPYSLLSGYSPSKAVKKWANVDDCIAEYQVGVFRNGAIPAGEMIITASTVEAYNEAVDQLQKYHRGPHNSNNIIYSHRPTSSIDGKPMTAGVEWVPFAQSNKDMTLDKIFEQANKKLSVNFGVPDEVKGFLQNSNYASAEVAGYVFSRWVVYPKLKKVYAKLTHEMSRIVGGNLGFSLSFDYELPALTDTKKVQAEALSVLLNQGFTPQSCVEALQLPQSFLRLVQAAPASEENLQALEDNRDKPTQVDPLKHIHNCEHCHSEAKAVGNLATDSLALLLNTYLTYFYTKIRKIDDDDTKALSSKITEVKNSVSTDPSAKVLRLLAIASVYHQLASKENEDTSYYAARFNTEKLKTALSADELLDFNLAIQSAIAQASTLVEIGGDLSRISTEAISAPVEKITKAMAAYGLHAGISDFAEGKTYQTQLNYLLTKFAKEQLTAWKDATKEASSITEALVIISQLLSTKSYPVERWAITEEHRGEELGKLLAAEEAGDVLELTPYKVWRIREGACEHCIALSGERVRVDKPFSNGNMVPSDHPNCRCYFEVEFDEKTKTVKVCCPECGRYMMESSGGVMKNVICANSKCKKHFDIEVKKGKIVATERSLV